jgi:hypothetical protein
MDLIAVLGLCWVGLRRRVGVFSRQGWISHQRETVELVWNWWIWKN